MLHSRPDNPATHVQRSTCSTCFLTHRVICTWVTPRHTPWVTFPRAIGSSKAMTSCTPLVGMRLDFLRKTRLSSAVRIQQRGPTKTLPPKRHPCVAMPVRLTGIASSIPVTRSTTTGTSGCSCKCLNVDWPIASHPMSTGAPIAKPSWPMSRSWAVCASAATQR